MVKRRGRPKGSTKRPTVPTIPEGTDPSHSPVASRLRPRKFDTSPTSTLSELSAKRTRIEETETESTTSEFSDSVPPVQRHRFSMQPSLAIPSAVYKYKPRDPLHVHENIKGSDAPETTTLMDQVTTIDLKDVLVYVSPSAGTSESGIDDEGGTVRARNLPKDYRSPLTDLIDL